MAHVPASLRRSSLAAFAGVALLAVAAVAQPATAAKASQRLVLYSVAQQEQFINNKDDRTRGKGSNPFGNFKDAAPAADRKANGPFEGDQALFSFNLYTTANLAKRIGSATFTCLYNFRQNAFCDAAFQLGNRGVLIASGGFNFNATRFTLAVTGGSGAYFARSGALLEVPSANHAQKLTFQLD